VLVETGRDEWLEEALDASRAEVKREFFEREANGFARHFVTHAISRIGNRIGDRRVASRKNLDESDSLAYSRRVH